MKKIIRLLSAFLVFCTVLSVIPTAFAAGVQVAAPAAILVDGESGLVLFEKNADKKMYPASTTKIMTAILALEHAKLTDTATASHEAVFTISYDSSSAGLYEGETLTVEQLVYTLMIASANDSANVLAEHVAGSISAFVDMMNKKAKELGAENTHYANTHGLHSEKHYTTARDLAKITAYAMKNPVFAQIVAMPKYTLPPTNKFDDKRYFTNTNNLINSESSYYMKDATGVKTGYTGEAKNCLVAAATRGNSSLIAVSLGSTPVEGRVMSFADCKNLLEYGFKNFPPQKIVSKGEIISDLPIKNALGARKVILEAESDLHIILPKGVAAEDTEVLEYIRKEVSAPIKKGDLMGRKEYWHSGVCLGQVNMVAIKDYKKMPLAPVVNLFIAIFGNIWLYIIILAVFGFMTYKENRRKNRRRSRR